MRPWKDHALDGMLVGLVALSVALSFQLWYPPDEHLAATTGPSVQPQPPAAGHEMPDIFRPDRILIRQSGTSLAPIHTGSSTYAQLWPQLKRLMQNLRVTGGAFPVEQVPARLVESPWIELQLPTPLLLSEWVELWRWDAPTLRNGTMRIDRITFYLGQPGAIYLSGPVGTPLYMADIPDGLRADLFDLIRGVRYDRYQTYRPLEAMAQELYLLPDLLVPVVDSMPVATMRAVMPDEGDEEARYFPDLSVVRQIDERDARSLTDGQRLLRFVATGALEFRTADPSSASAAPEMRRALTLTQEWLGSHGGWPSDVVLRRYLQQPGRTRLEFDFRGGSEYPVESVGAALQAQVSAQRVVYFARTPAFEQIQFTDQMQPVIAPEAALARMAKEFPALLMEPIRSLHLAYMAIPGPAGQASAWRVEPAWVIQVADVRVYVFAAEGKETEPSRAIR